MKKLTFNEIWGKEIPKFHEYFEEKHMTVKEVAEIYNKNITN